MSANPQPRRLVEGDLDLLISRSLDGDLPAADERELRDLLASDPSARARYDAMARLVGRLEEIPDPEIPFALATRVNSQVEADSQGLVAALHRFGFYFRPATVFVFVAGIVAVGLAYTLRNPPQPASTVAAARTAPASAPADDRVSVFFGPSDRKDAAAAPEAAPAEARPADAAPAREAAAKAQEPVLVASAESARERDEKEEAFVPEPRAAKAAAAPAPAPMPQAADFSPAAERPAVVAQDAPPRSGKTLAAASRASVLPAGPTVEVVGKAAGALRLAAPAKLDGLAGPFEGSYRLDLDASGRVIEAVRLFGGSGTEPSGLGERLRGLSFVPVEAARGAGSVDVKVRIP